jgi:hypothetical protein
LSPTFKATESQETGQVKQRLLLLFLVCIPLALIVRAGPAAVQDDGLESRLRRIAGIDPETTSAFLDALRRNVGRDDRPATCAMVQYPLKHADGTVTNAAECEARYDSIFTRDVRKAVGMQQFADLFVNQDGVMVGAGELWFAARCGEPTCRQTSDLRVIAVNSQAVALVPPAGKVLLGCVVSGQRIRVSADGQGSASLSVWRSARTGGAPDVAFPRAAAGSTAECGARSWTFTDGARTYQVSDLPCDAYLSPPPMGSVGRVTLSTGGTGGSPLWCFE